MTEEEALAKFKEPQRINSPEECNFVIAFLTGWLSDQEEALNEENFQVSVKLMELLTVNKNKLGLSERQLEMTDIYRKREKTKLTIAQLRRHRQDLKDRFSVLTGGRY